MNALRVLAVLATLAAAGCASISEKECRSGDWGAIGEADGARGAPGDMLERHRKACARHDIQPAEAAWRAGYAKGLQAFCTPAGGYGASRDGRGHNNVCFGMEGEDKFMAAFKNGNEVHVLLRDVRDSYRRLRDIETAMLSGQYSEYELTQVRLRAAEMADVLRRKQWELEKLDAGYSKDYGVKALTDADMQRAY
jgi:hypothetical protein